MYRKKILFIINPVSGGKRKSAFNKQVLEVLDLDAFDPTFQRTSRENHAYELAKKAIEKDYDAVVAVGGDGTINEIGAALSGTNMPLGIIPEGSGNGLALCLGIPLNESAAIRRINRFEIMEIDSGMINGHEFFNVSGMGFDANVSFSFAEENIRGPIGYLRSIINVLSKYKPSKYKITIDGKAFEREAFMISIANSPQFGNNAYVAPNASVTDGLLDVCIVHKFPFYILPRLIFHMFNRSADQSEYVEIIPGKEIKIERQEKGLVHIDGEPIELEEDINVQVMPRSLKIIC
ncbi:MAG TPA: diacylglycerol kinase family protein [Sphingobacterium sp.]|nr:diacylglycerol kinase family protein [Sphingobacterium sp.]